MTNFTSLWFYNVTIRKCQQWGGRMGDVVYVDVLLLENFLMNFLLLYTLKRICNIKAKTLNIAVAALIGALYVVFIFFPEFNVMYTLLMKFMMSLIMIVVSFTPHKIKDLIKIVILFYIETFIAGGSIIAIFYLTNKNIDITKGALITDVSSIYLVIGVFVAILFVKLGFDYFENHYRTNWNKIEIQIVLENRKCRINALIDTGNTLKDPVSNVPVIVAYQKSLIELFPDELKEYILKDYSYEIITKKLMESSLKSRIRIIPYRALGTENGILVALRTDMAVIKYKDNSNIIFQPIVALYDKPISVNGDYEALAYPEILK